MMGQANKLDSIDHDVITHAITSIQLAADTLKRKGALKTLEDTLDACRPPSQPIEANVRSITAYSQGQQDYLKGVDYTNPPQHIANLKDWQKGWRDIARNQCAMYHDLQAILEKSPEIEAALRGAGKVRLANMFQKLFTPPLSEEGRSAECV